MTPLQELESAIRTALPRLNAIEVGQRFESEYYGEIIAANIDFIGNGDYIVYWFELIGTPLAKYYPQDLTLLGKRILLSDVLEWIHINTFSDFKDYYIHADGEFGLLRFEQYEGNNKYWNLSLPYLDQQSPETINWLHSLIKPQ